MAVTIMISISTLLFSIQFQIEPLKNKLAVYDLSFLGYNLIWRF